MNEAYKDFEEGKLSPKEIAKKYGVAVTTIYNWKKRWKIYVEKKTQSDKIASFAKHCAKIADHNVKGGINNHTKSQIEEFIMHHKFDNMDVLQETYEKFGVISDMFDHDNYRVGRFYYTTSFYISLSCLFDIKLVNNNEYFHYIVSHRDEEEL